MSLPFPRVLHPLWVILCAIPMLAPGCDRASGQSSAKSKAGGKKVCVLGCDGMDPKLVTRMMKEGRLPNFSRLAAKGAFKNLTTSIPPQSPVAWSNFITGAGPGEHGVFDFIHRDPARQAHPYSSASKVEESPDDHPVEFGRKYQVPKSQLLPWVDGPTLELVRSGKPFWDFLDEAGVPVQMYKLPANYPPSKSEHGHACCLAGMGVPDGLGNQGTYEHFSTRPRKESKGGEGYKLRLRAGSIKGKYVAEICGPKNEYLKALPEMVVKMAIYPDPRNNVAKLVYENEGVTGNQTVELVLNAGEWSDWTEVHFLKTPAGPVFRTMVRFLLQSVRPELEVYMTPLNFVASDPAAPISEPPEFASEIADAIGPYHTQGFAEAFNARKHKLLTDEEYRIQAENVLVESERMMDYALERFQDGLLFFYYSSTDLQAHIFWWDSDDKHPVRSPEEAKKYMGVVEDVYIRMDKALAKCMAKLGDDTTYIVMSDHGFGNFRRCVGLCTWLRDEGYLVAKSNVVTDADWTKTRAYGLGINGLYVNLKGREIKGIVDPADRTALLDEITAKLLALKDPDTGQQVIHRVYRAEEAYSGPLAMKGPDLIIGYNKEYRASWNTCLGEFDKAVVFDNENAWSADHCIAHDLVPGIIVTNRAFDANEPALIDLGPTILSEFGVPAPKYMTGQNLFTKQPQGVASR